MGAVTKPASSGLKSCTLKLGSSQSISNVTYTKCDFSTVDTDDNSWADTANDRITPTESGNFIVLANFHGAGTAGTGTYVVQVRKNGSAVATLKVVDGATVSYQIASKPIAMNGTTDYLEIWTFQSSGGAKSLDGTANESQFTVMKVE